MSHSSIEKWCFASVNSVYALHISIMYLATTFRPKTPANKAAMIKTPTRDHSKDSFENTCCRVFRNFHLSTLYHLTYVGSRVVLEVAFQSKSNLKPKCGSYSRSLYVAALTCLKQFCAKVLKASVRCIRETRKKAFLKISLLAPRLVELHAVEFVGFASLMKIQPWGSGAPEAWEKWEGKDIHEQNVTSKQNWSVNVKTRASLKGTYGWPRRSPARS